MYPDIDTVPDFKDVIITKEDSLELCKMINPYEKSKYYISPSNVLIISPSKVSISVSGYAQELNRNNKIIKNLITFNII